MMKFLRQFGKKTAKNETAAKDAGEEKKELLKKLNYLKNKLEQRKKIRNS